MAILVGVTWYLAGWLPSRIMKEYFTAEYGPSGWEEGEVIALLMGLLGPCGGLGTVIARCAMKGRLWGWKW